MAVTLGIANLNLLGPSNWTTGGDGIAAANGYPAFNRNGDANEQNRYTGTDPWGNSAIVWQCASTGGNDASGGWDTSSFAIDNTQMYRFSVWMRRTSSTTGGTFYLGTQSSTGAVYNRSGGNAESNPYWTCANIGNYPQNQWFLFVGHVYPVGSTGGSHPDSGIYYPGNINKWTPFTGTFGCNIAGDASWQAGTTSTYHRCYHYYCTDTTSRIEFYDPRVDLCNGTQPSITRLLTQPLTNSNHGVVFADGSANAPKLTDTGQLISITSYTGSGNYTVPSNARMVYVQLIGGGGGSAGYNESGGAGGYAEGMYYVTPSSTIYVTVGGGGGGVGYYGTGGQGGTTSFGSYISATGGHGANAQVSHAGGVGGVGSGGQVNTYGGAGTGHANHGSHAQTAHGGAGFFGGCAGQQRGGGAHNFSGTLGSGATGGITQISNVGSGAPGGLCIIYAYT